MAEEEGSVNPMVLRDRRRRRRHSASTSEEAKKASSTCSIVAQTSSKEPLNQESNSHENGEVLVNEREGKDNMKKKRPSKRQTPEPEISADSKENVGMGRNERRRQRRGQTPQRLPRSVSEEVLAIEGKFQMPLEQINASRPPTQSRRIRRPRRRDADQLQKEPVDDTTEGQNAQSPEHQTSERQPVRPRPRSLQPRKKRKTRSAMMTSGDEENYQGDMDGEVSEIFKIDKEDIIHADSSESTGKIIAINQATLPSQPLDYLFIEKKDGQGFLKEHKSRLERVYEETNELAQDVSLQTKAQSSLSMKFALHVHRLYQTVALICHGILAGLSLTQCIFVYSLTDTSYSIFLENYHKLAQPFQSIYYFLLIICVVSVFDRYINVSLGWSQFFLTLLTRPSRAIAIIGYLIALIFSVSLAQLDDKIGLFKDSPELWASTNQIATWRVINLIRVIGAILGWIAISMNPLDDHAAGSLNAAIEQERAESGSTSRVKLGNSVSLEHDMP